MVVLQTRVAALASGVLRHPSWPLPKSCDHHAGSNAAPPPSRPLDAANIAALLRIFGVAAAVDPGCARKHAPLVNAQEATLGSHLSDHSAPLRRTGSTTAWGAPAS